MFKKSSKIPAIMQMIWQIRDSYLPMIELMLFQPLCTVKGFEVAIVVMSESNPIVARRETLAQKGC